MITLANISKTFNAGRQNEFTAVKGINAVNCLNTITVLKGPSGSGKTTLLSIIGCMARPTAGRITVQEPGDYQPSGTVSHRDPAQHVRLCVPELQPD